MSVIKSQKEVLFALLAFLLLLIPLAGRNSFWLDELYSVYTRGIRYDGIWEHIKSQWVTNRSYPLYEVSLFIWMKFFGSGESAVRMLSILYSLLAAIFLYLFTMRLLGKRVAILVTVLFLFSSMNIQYALEARYYSQMLMVTTLSSWLFLRYLEQLKGLTWKDLFNNRAFLWLSLVNAALILNHTFNYLFLAVQGLFFLVCLICMRSGEHLLIRMIKAVAVYLAPMLITALVWLPAYSMLWNPKAMNYLQEVLRDSLMVLKSNLNWKTLLFMGLFLLGLTLFAFLMRKLVPHVKRMILSAYPETDFYKLKVVSLFSLAGVAILFLYVTDYGFLGVFIKTFFQHPATIFRSAMLYVNFGFPNYLYVIILILLVIVFIKYILRLYRGNMGRIALIRRLSLLYLLFWLFVPTVLVFIMLSFAQLDKFAPRYILFGLPALMIFVSLAIEQALGLLNAVTRWVAGFSFSRFYERYSSIWAIILAFIIVGPGGYRAAMQEKTDWRGMSEEIVHAVEQDAAHTYIVYETTFQDVPTLNYYLHRQSEHISVGGVVQRREEDSITMFESYRPRILREEYRKVIEQHDYLLVAFTHQQETHFPNTLELLSSIYKLESNMLANDGRGFLVFDTRARDN